MAMCRELGVQLLLMLLPLLLGLDVLGPARLCSSPEEESALGA